MPKGMVRLPPVFNFMEPSWVIVLVTVVDCKSTIGLSKTRTLPLPALLKHGAVSKWHLQFFFAAPYRIVGCNQLLTDFFMVMA